MNEDELYKRAVEDELLDEIAILDSIDLTHFGFSEDGVSRLKATLHHALEYIHNDGKKIPVI